MKIDAREAHGRHPRAQPAQVNARGDSLSQLLVHLVLIGEAGAGGRGHVQVSGRHQLGEDAGSRDGPKSSGACGTDLSWTLCSSVRAFWQLGSAAPGPGSWSRSLLELETSRPALVSVRAGASAAVKVDSSTRTSHPVTGLQNKIRSALSYLNRKSVSLPGLERKHIQ